VKCDRGRRNTTVLFRHEKRRDWETPELELERRGGEVCGSGVDVVILNSEVDSSEVCQLVKVRVGEW
jgi:hypothetical protein